MLTQIGERQALTSLAMLGAALRGCRVAERELLDDIGCTGRAG